MPFQLYTVNHLTHSLTDVARAAEFAESCEPQWLEQSGVHSLVVLSTCNRVEIYLSADPNVRLVESHEIIDEPDKLFSPDSANTPAPDPQPQNHSLVWNYLEGRAVAEHLFRVAAGLDSMVVGEAEVAGQVRRAFARATQSHQVKGLLVRMFEGALATSRRVSSETSLTGLGRSVVSVALDLATDSLASRLESIENWSSLNVVLVGTGAYAGNAVAQLRARGVRRIYNVSTSSRVAAFARTHSTEVVAPANLVSALAQADLVVACRGIGAPVLNLEQVRSAVSNREESAAHPLVILDLALQRDVEEGVSDLPGVVMFSLEDIRSHVPALAVSQIQRANDLVEAGLAEWDATVAARHMDPVIVKLRAIFEAAAKEEIDRLPAGEFVSREAAQRAIRHVIAKLAHTPTVSAHMAAESGLGSEWVDALATVWGLTPDVLEDAIR